MPYKKRVLQTDFPIHITARSNNRERFPIPLDEAWELFSNYLYFLHHNFDLKILSFVLMPNHFHLLARDPSMQLPSGMNYFFRETSKIMGKKSGRINRLWGAPYHSSIIESPLYYLHAYKYVYRNPVLPTLAAKPTEWRYSTLGQLLGQHRGIIPLEEDHTLFADVEGVLNWLDIRPPKEHEDAVKNALSKKTFTLRKDRKTQKAHLLERERF